MSTNEQSFRSPGVLVFEHPGGGNFEFDTFTMRVKGPVLGDSITQKVEKVGDVAQYLILFGGQPGPSATYTVQPGDTPRDVVVGLAASFSLAGVTFTDNGDDTYTISNDTPLGGIGFIVIAASPTFVDFATADQFASEGGIVNVDDGVHGVSINNGAYLVSQLGNGAATIDTIGTALANSLNPAGAIAGPASYDATSDLLTIESTDDTENIVIASTSNDTGPVETADGGDGTVWLRDQNRNRTFLIVENLGGGDARINFGQPADVTASSEQGIIVPASGERELVKTPGGTVNIAVSAATRFLVLVGNA